MDEYEEALETAKDWVVCSSCTDKERILLENILLELREFRKEITEEEALEEAAKNYCKGSSFSDAVMEKPAFKAGSRWQIDRVIEKVCEWIKKGGYFINNTETIRKLQKL